MTIIAAQKTTTGVVLGADNTIGDGSRIIRRADPKIVAITPRIAVGTAGLVRLGDVVRSYGFWEKSASRHSLFDEMHEVEGELGKIFRNLLTDEPADTPFWALVAVDREIFHVGPGGSVTRVDASYCALGNAELVALGVLYVLHRTDGGALHGADLAKTRLTLALEASAEHIEAIRPPWTFVETKAPT